MTGKSESVAGYYQPVLFTPEIAPASARAKQFYYQ
jgi:hypothetical protein